MNTVSDTVTKKSRKLILKWGVGFWLACISVSPNLYGEVVVDRIVAQVNDDIITLSDLNQAMVPALEDIKTKGYPPAQEQELFFKARSAALDDLISKKLTNQVAREEGINISEKEIDNALEDIKKKNSMTEEQFLKALDNENITIVELRKNLRDELLRHRLLMEEVQSKIVVTNEDVEAYYKEHSDKYGGKQKYHLRSIIKRIPQYAEEKQVNSIVQSMEDLIKKLDAGASFADQAKENSDLLAEEGGDLGNFELNQLSEEIRPAVKELRVGGHTPIIQTAQGLQIFYLQEMVETEGIPIDSVSNEIKDILYKKAADDKIKEWISSIKEKAHIKIVQ